MFIKLIIRQACSKTIFKGACSQTLNVIVKLVRKLSGLYYVNFWLNYESNHVHIQLVYKFPDKKKKKLVYKFKPKLKLFPEPNSKLFTGISAHLQ